MGFTSCLRKMSWPELQTSDRSSPSFPPSLTSLLTSSGARLPDIRLCPTHPGGLRLCAGQDTREGGRDSSQDHLVQHETGAGRLPGRRPVRPQGPGQVRRGLCELLIDNDTRNDPNVVFNLTEKCHSEAPREPEPELAGGEAGSAGGRLL